MTDPHSVEATQQALVTLWKEITQAHFLQSLTIPEALVVLRERREHLHRLLQPDSGQEQHTSSALLLAHFRLLLTAELDWIEWALAILQRSGNNLRGGRGERVKC
jgi:hypothetical protein